MVSLPIGGLRQGAEGRRVSPRALSPGRRLYGRRNILRFLILGGCASIIVTTGLVSGLFAHSRGGVGGVFGLEERTVAIAASIFATEGGDGLREKLRQQDLETGEYVLKDTSSLSLSSSSGDYVVTDQDINGDGDGDGDDERHIESSTSRSGWQFVSARDADNYGLNEEQCNVAFPKLFVELEKSVQQRKENRSMIIAQDVRSRRIEDGMVRGLIYDGEVGRFLLPITPDGGEFANNWMV
jgi:hypothetical protein